MSNLSSLNCVNGESTRTLYKKALLGNICLNMLKKWTPAFAHICMHTFIHHTPTNVTEWPVQQGLNSIILHLILISHSLSLLPIQVNSFQLPPPAKLAPLSLLRWHPLWFSPPPLLSWAKLDSRATEADVPGAHDCPQPTPSPHPPPAPPICTGSAVNPRKELAIQAHTHSYKEHCCPNL